MAGPAVAALISDESPAVTASVVVVQAVGYVGLLAAAGLVMFRVVLLPPGEGFARAASRLRRPAFVAALLAGVAFLALLPLTTARQAGRDLSTLADLGAWTVQLDAAPGLTAWLVIGGLAVALGGVVRTQLGAPALAGAVLALGSLALAGHSRTFGPSWLVLSYQLLHVVTAAVWFGGLIGLWTVLAGAGRQVSAGPGAAAVQAPALTPAQAGAVVSRFSTAAAASVSMLAMAGVILGWRIVGSWDALFGTTYGVTLLVKAGMALVVVAVAAFNRYRLLPQLEGATQWRMLRRTVGVEAAVLVAVLAVTGFLVNQSPREDQAAPADNVQTYSMDA